MKKALLTIALLGFLLVPQGANAELGKVDYRAKDYRATWYLRTHVGKIKTCDRHAKAMVNLEKEVRADYGYGVIDGIHYLSEEGMELMKKYAARQEKRANDCLKVHKKGWK